MRRTESKSSTGEFGGRLAPREGAVRTCTGCRRTTEKREMLRIVKTREGVVVDPEQRLSGRGAYVHRDVGCVRTAAERGSLGKTLRCTVPADVVAEVVAVLGSQGTR